uniref:Uncharacterized protein n=1 Tax=Vespula pensylvanica TaxID=30213 RepID=A0A834P8E9_VESPE|nr:hypothetical protein H0235_004454 [Vespula pensylvanica]
MGADGHFRVTLSLRREPAAGPVYCKMETSARFRQLKTVKLSCEAMYRLDISFKPPQLLQWIINLTIMYWKISACKNSMNVTVHPIHRYSAYDLATRDVHLEVERYMEMLYGADSPRSWLYLMFTKKLVKCTT